MPNKVFIVAEFSDGIQVIPKMWLQSKDFCKYPSHYKTDSRIRKAIEKEEPPASDWSSFKIERIFGEYPSLQKADEKARRAIYTSDLDTDKEARSYRKMRAKRVVYSSESEEESCADTTLSSPPSSPKRQRLHDTDEIPSYSSLTYSGKSMKRNSESNKTKQKVSNSNSQSFSQDVDNRNEKAHSSAGYAREEENEKNIPNQHVDDKVEENDRSSCKMKQGEKIDDHLNHQSSQDAIVDYLKRLTREIAFIKYDMRQSLSLLDILVKKTNTETEANKNTEVSFEDVETRFPLETTEQLMEVEEILKRRDSQHNVALRAYIKSIGGTNVIDAVKRTLYKLFSNKLAEKFNWEGRCGKEPLRKLELIKVIFSCILQNVPDTDHGKIQRRIMEWFRHSKARHQNEEKRKAQGEDGSVD